MRYTASSGIEGSNPSRSGLPYLESQGRHRLTALEHHLERDPPFQASKVALAGAKIDTVIRR